MKPFEYSHFLYPLPPPLRGRPHRRRDRLLRLPVPVKAAIFQREGGFKTVVFDLVEEE